MEVKKSLKFVIIEIATLSTLRRDFKSRNSDKEFLRDSERRHCRRMQRGWSWRLRHVVELATMFLEGELKVVYRKIEVQMIIEKKKV